MANDYSKTKPGDILLYNGTSYISWIIKKLDNSEVSHAGIYLGNGQIAESLENGVVIKDISSSFQNCEWVRCSRHRNAEQNPDKMKSVLDYAKNIAKNRHPYAYGQIALLAIICSCRKIDYSDPILRKIAHAALVLTHKSLKQFQKRFRDKEPMICSQFVYLCYQNATQKGETNPCQIEIHREVDDFKEEFLLSASAPDMSGGKINDKQVDEKELMRLIQQYKSKGGSAEPPMTAQAAEANAPSFEQIQAEAFLLFQNENAFSIPREMPMALGVFPEFVTPGDLDRSQSLGEIDKLSPPQRKRRRFFR